MAASCRWCGPTLPCMPSSSRAFITGVGNTAFGKHPGRGTLELMGEAATRALADADLASSDVDAVLCGYATTLPHLMLATLFCERFGLAPSYVHSIQAGGATGAAMVMLAGDLVRAGRCSNVLVVGGENRATGQSRDTSVQALAQVGDAEHEVPLALGRRRGWRWRRWGRRRRRRDERRLRVDHQREDQRGRAHQLAAIGAGQPALARA